MRLLLFIALLCFIVMLLCAAFATDTFRAGLTLAWLAGGMISLTCAWLFGPWVDRKMGWAPYPGQPPTA